VSFFLLSSVFPPSGLPPSLLLFPQYKVKLIFSPLFFGFKRSDKFCVMGEHCSAMTSGHFPPSCLVFLFLFSSVVLAFVFPQVFFPPLMTLYLSPRIYRKGNFLLLVRRKQILSDVAVSYLLVLLEDDCFAVLLISPPCMGFLCLFSCFRSTFLTFPLLAAK